MVEVETNQRNLRSQKVETVETAAGVTSASAREGGRCTSIGVVALAAVLLTPRILTDYAIAIHVGELVKQEPLDAALAAGRKESHRRASVLRAGLRQ